MVTLCSSEIYFVLSLFLLKCLRWLFYLSNWSSVFPLFFCLFVCIFIVICKILILFHLSNLPLNIFYFNELYTFKIKVSFMWTIFKAFIGFFTIFLLLFIFWSVWQWGTWDLSSPTKDWTHTPYFGRQSFNHWATGKIPVPYFVKFNLLHRCSVLSFRGC